MYDFEKLDKRKILLGYIFLVSNRLQTVMDNKIPELSAKQWFVSIMLGMFDEPPTLKQLAEMCCSSHQNTKQIVLKLEEKGFLAIYDDKDDKRAIRIKATDKLRKWERTTQQSANDFLSAMFSDLSQEQLLELSESLGKIHKKLGQILGNS